VTQATPVSDKACWLADIQAGCVIRGCEFTPHGSDDGRAVPPSTGETGIWIGPVLHRLARHRARANSLTERNVRFRGATAAVTMRPPSVRTFSIAG
jgi:hypothetical protein